MKTKIYNHKLDRYFLISIISFFIIPIFGVIIAFFKVNSNNAKKMVLILSLFVFFLCVYLPPYQDLYRRYIETYFSYNELTTLKTAIYGHVDILFYINSLYFKRLNIPFFYIPAIYSSLSVCFIMMAFVNFSNNSVNGSRDFKVKFFVVFCFINIFTIALGLRFGFAIALLVRGLDISYNGKRKNAFIYMILAVLMHFSIFFVVIIFVASKFLKVNKKAVIGFALLFTFISKLIIPFILSRLNFAGIGDYVTSGYIDGTLSSINLNLNALIISVFSYFVIVILSFYFLVINRKEKDAFSNFLSIYFASCFITFLSFTAFNRYFVGVGTILFLIDYVRHASFSYSNFKRIFLTISIINLLFINIYVQRRPLDLGNVWRGALYPPVFVIDYNMSDFNNYLRSINEDGDWIGHQLNTNRGG